LAFPPEEALEGLPRRRLFPLIRLVMARGMRGKHQRPEPPPRPNDPPGAAIVSALGNSPAAGVFRRTIDASWTSDVLPRRTKALLHAVIARALGCTISEREAYALLANEGLAASEVDDILANLGSPRLDERERLLVPFARETVRYQVAAIQRRTHAI